MLRKVGGLISFRAAEDEKVEKKRIKIRLCIPEILRANVSGLPVITSKIGSLISSSFLSFRLSSVLNHSTLEFRDFSKRAPGI